MTIFAVTYAYDPNRPADLQNHRPAHREFLGKLHEDGTLLASGPLGELGALLILRAESEENALEILSADPLIRETIVIGKTAEKWTQVYGPWADNK